MKGSRWVVGFDAFAAARTCANMRALDMVSERVSGTAEHKSFAQVKGSYVSPIPIVSIVVPFLGYLIGSVLYIWLNQKRNYNGDCR